MSLGGNSNQDMKMQVFQLQRQINDFEYNATQQETKMKRKHEEELSKKRKILEQQFQKEFELVEEERNRQYQLEDQKNQLGRQLETVLQHIFNDQNEKEMSNDNKQASLEKLNKSLTTSKQLQQQVAQLNQEQKNLSEKILHLSMGNGIKQNDKDTVTIMLLSIVKQMNGLRMKNDGLTFYLQQIENQLTKQEVQVLLQKYRLIK